MSMTTRTSSNPFIGPPPVRIDYPHAVHSGHVILYKDASWESEKFVLDINSPQVPDGPHFNSSQLPEGQYFSFSGTAMNKAATWIVFNLPPGVVLTLVNALPGRPPENPYDFAQLGVTIDLIGNGTRQTVDLVEYGADNTFSGGIWRTVDTSEGWVQLFEEDNCDGRFVTFFFNEWPTNERNSLVGWFFDNRASSINYPCLTPPQVITLSGNADGSGPSVSLGATNPAGTWEKQATANFKDSGANKAISGWTYSIIAPVKAVISSTSVTLNAGVPPGNQFYSRVFAQNNSEEPVTVSLLLAQGTSSTVTASYELQYSQSLEVSMTISASGGFPSIDSFEASVTTSFTASASETSSRSDETTAEFDLEQTITLTAPAYKEFKGEALVQLGEFPMTAMTTTGYIYYDSRLPGATPDPHGSGLYILEQPVTVYVSGGIGSQVTVDATATSLPSGDSDAGTILVFPSGRTARVASSAAGRKSLVHRARSLTAGRAS